MFYSVECHLLGLGFLPLWLFRQFRSPIIFNDFVLDAVEDESVMVFEAVLNSQSAITVTSI